MLVFGILIGASYCDSVTPSLYRKLTASFSKNQEAGFEEAVVSNAMQLLAYTGISSVLFLAGTYLTTISGEAVSSRLRLDLFEALETLPFWFFSLNKTGHYISLFNHQLHGAQNGISKTIPKIITNLLTILMAAYQLLQSDWKLASGLVLLFPGFILITETLQSRMRSSHKQAHDLRSQMNDKLKASFSSAAVLAKRNFGIQTARSEFATTSQHIQAAQESIAFFQDVHTRLIYLLFAVISSFAFVGIGFYLKSMRGLEVDPADLVQLVTALNKLQGPLVSLGTIQVDLSNTFLCFESIFQQLEDVEQYRAKMNEKTGFNARPLLKLSAWPGDVTISNVNFYYPDPSEIFSKVDMELKADGAISKGRSEKDVRGQNKASDDKAMVLKNINMKISHGSKVALVGPNGSGKSTLAFLLAGLHSPSSGTVSVAAHPYTSLDDPHLSRFIGILDQDPWFDNDTLLANFLAVAPNSELSAIENACDSANILDFIRSLPEGFQTKIGENGARLSSGQRQLLALARLILKNPSFIILDEFNAHLSSQAESLVFSTLMKYFANATIVVITHRLSILPKMDEIYYLLNGEIVEHGSHSTLLASKGPYAELFDQIW